MDNIKEPGNAHSYRVTNGELNRVITLIALRAEEVPEQVAQSTFVSVRELTDSLSRIDNQIVYGRRGTGKTHAFRNLETVVDRSHDLPIYIDMRNIGSSGGLYGDTSLSRAARGTQLLVDLLIGVHTKLLNVSLTDDRFENLLPHLDALAEAISEVRVEGSVNITEERREAFDESNESGDTISLGTSNSGLKASLSGKATRKKTKATAAVHKRERTGTETPRVLFGSVSKALGRAVDSIAPRRVWIMLDEWSNVPLDLQPLLADLLRRSVFPVYGVTVKIAAIERRSTFSERVKDADYLGIELGADTAAAINLDEHILEENERIRFFAELLYRHMRADPRDGYRIAGAFKQASDLVRTVFDRNALREFVRASEGVPRDALQIASLAASRANDRAIRPSDIHHAARRFYLNDKEKRIWDNSLAQATQKKLMKEVVFENRSRAFLVRRDVINSSHGILDLHDARLIHLMEPGIQTSADPGTTYDGYCLDFGSYVEVLEEAEMVNLWNASRRWRGGFAREIADLSDSFSRAMIFTPPRKKNKQGTST